MGNILCESDYSLTETNVFYLGVYVCLFRIEKYNLLVLLQKIIKAILKNKTMHTYNISAYFYSTQCFSQMKISCNMVMNVKISTSPSLGPYVGLKTQKLAKEIPPLVPIANPQLHYLTLGKVHIIFKLYTNQC